MAPETVVLPDGRTVVLIHLLVGGKIACMPNLEPSMMCSNRERAAPHMRTEDPASATCPMCRKKL